MLMPTRRVSWAGAQRSGRPCPFPRIETAVRKGPRAMFKVLGIIVVVIVLVMAGITWVSLSWVYSDGERAGYVQKFSRRGWVCKTWEGEMAMVTMPGTMSEKFAFTVTSAAVANTINAGLGKRMAVHYEQHR